MPLNQEGVSGPFCVLFKTHLAWGIDCSAETIPPRLNNGLDSSHNLDTRQVSPHDNDLLKTYLEKGAALGLRNLGWAGVLCCTESLLAGDKTKDLLVYSE